MISVGLGIIDYYKGLRNLLRMPRTDAVVMLLVLVVTAVVDLLQAVGIGLVLASLFFMKRMSDLADVQLEKTLLRETTLPDEEGLFDDKDLEHIFIKHLSGPFFFGFTSKFRQLVSQLPAVKVVIMRMEEVPYIDQSGLIALEDAILDLETRGIQVVLTGLQERPEARLRAINIVPDLIAERHLFPNIAAAADWAKQHIKK